MKPVLTKQDFVQRYIAGEFGNRPRTWLYLNKFMSSGYQNLVHVRNMVIGGKTVYNVYPIDVPLIWQSIKTVGIPYISEMGLPDEHRIFQGEVMRGIWGLELTYTTVAKPMRDALRESTKTGKGIIANSLLSYFLCPNSHDWLMILLDRYTNHVVEFTSYDTCWGEISGFNTLFWEVRNY